MSSDGHGSQISPKLSSSVSCWFGFWSSGQLSAKSATPSSSSSPLHLDAPSVKFWQRVSGPAQVPFKLAQIFSIVSVHVDVSGIQHAPIGIQHVQILLPLHAPLDIAFFDEQMKLGVFSEMSSHVPNAAEQASSISGHVSVDDGDGDGLGVGVGVDDGDGDGTGVLLIEEDPNVTLEVIIVEDLETIVDVVGSGIHLIVSQVELGPHHVPLHQSQIHS